MLGQVSAQLGGHSLSGPSPGAGSPQHVACGKNRQEAGAGARWTGAGDVGRKGGRRERGEEEGGIMSARRMADINRDREAAGAGSGDTVYIQTQVRTHFCVLIS